jgi:hypothetical protein
VVYDMQITIVKGVYKPTNKIKLFGGPTVHAMK